MSNRTYLLNVRTDQKTISEVGPRDGTSIEVAGGANRIPILWLYCFSKADLIPVTYALSETEILSIPTPHIEVALAVENLKSAEHRLAKLCGDTEIASGYLQDSLFALQGLPYKYLTIDFLELLYLFDSEQAVSIFANCYGTTDEAHPFIKQVSGFIDGIAPYPLGEFLELLGGDENRNENSASLYFNCIYSLNQQATSSTKGNSLSHSASSRTEPLPPYLATKLQSDELSKLPPIAQRLIQFVKANWVKLLLIILIAIAVQFVPHTRLHY